VNLPAAQLVCEARRGGHRFAAVEYHSIVYIVGRVPQYSVYSG